MPGPPWRLISPSGTLYFIADEDALKHLCTVEVGANGESMKVGNMKQLVGLHQGSSEQQQFKYGWQLFEKCLF